MGVRKQQDVERGDPDAIGQAHREAVKKMPFGAAPGNHHRAYDKERQLEDQLEVQTRHSDPRERQYPVFISNAPGAGSPPGRLHHTCYGDKSALRVTDVYDTPQSFESFGKVLVPILSSLGVDVGKPDVVEVHNIVRG